MNPATRIALWFGFAAATLHDGWLLVTCAGFLALGFMNEPGKETEIEVLLDKKDKP